MARTLTRPRDPEGLGRTIAALRVYAGQRPAQTNAERAAVDTMRTQGISPDVAARMVGRIDAMRASVRTQLLGKSERPTLSLRPRFALQVRAPLRR